MPEDGQDKQQSIADALDESAAQSDGEDATVQISKAELAAIRQSADNPAMTPEMLREINRRRSQAESSDDDPQESTRTFDRSSLDSLLKQGPNPDGVDQPDAVDQDEVITGVADGALADAAIEDAIANADWIDPETAEVDVDDVQATLEDERAAAQDDKPTVAVEDSDDDIDFDDILSDDDIAGAVLGDDSFVEAALADDASDAEFAGEGLDELSDADLHAVVFGGDEPEPTAKPERPAQPKTEHRAKPEPRSAHKPTPKPAAPVEPPKPEPAKPEPAKPAPPKPAPRPVQDQQPAPPSRPAPAPSFDDEPLGDFRGTESRLLTIVGSLGGLALIAAGSARIATDDTLTQIHPVVAGMMIVLGCIFLIGVAVSVLRR